MVENILRIWAFQPFEEKSFKQHSICYWSKVVNHSFIYSFNKHLLNTSYVSGTVLSTKNGAVNKYIPTKGLFSSGEISEV